MSHRTCGRLLLAALCAAGAWVALPSVGKPQFFEQAVPVSAGTASAPVYRGVGSCASSACHGGDGRQTVKRSEYTVWIEHDKHAQAYRILLTERSRAIERNYRHLGRLADAHAEKDIDCLKCHALDPAGARLGQAVATEDGVGCERCHGPAGRWLPEHFLLDWKQKSLADKQALGFRDTKDLVQRARSCVECHVGAEGQEVNHDLYAAGHPRVNFEYGSFLSSMYPHWSLADERRRYPDVQARAWAIGQVLTAHASLDLLASRTNPKADKPWPEFAEYDCYACHHDLSADSWRQKRGYRGIPGALTPNTWYFTELPRALELGALGKVNGLDDLRKEMAAIHPDKERVHQLARQAADQLARSLDEWNRLPTTRVAELRRQFDALASADPKEAAYTWDGAAQHYLALAALYNALTDLDPGQKDATVRAALEAMSRSLQFPRVTPPQALDSPRGVNPASIEGPWKALRVHRGQ